MERNAGAYSSPLVAYLCKFTLICEIFLYNRLTRARRRTFDGITGKSFEVSLFDREIIKVTFFSQEVIFASSRRGFVTGRRRNLWQSKMEISPMLIYSKSAAVIYSLATDIISDNASRYGNERVIHSVI